jgi:hypothetical protein
LKVSALFVLALIVVAAVFLLAPTDRTWPETKRALEARGEVLDWEKMIPPPVPPEENLFDDPVAASLLPLKGNPTPANPLGVGAPRLPPACEALGVPFALSNLVNLPKNADVKKELSLAELDEWFAQWDESFVQLRAVGKRPKAHFRGDYSSPLSAPIPNFVAARTLSQVLSSRAKVHLLMGDSPAAFADLETLRVVMKSFEAQPGTLVMAMIHVAVAGLYLETVEEGLRHKLWADAELQKITPQLLEINFLHIVKVGIRAERAGVLRHLDALAERRRDPIYQATRDAFSSGKWTSERAVIEFSPTSWIRANQAQYARIIQGYLDGIDPEKRRIDQRQIDHQNAEVMELVSRWSPKKSILFYVTPNFSKAATTMGKNQMRAHQLALACALERYHSTHDCYPKTLDELVPAYISTLPKDVYSGMTIPYELSNRGYELSATARQVKHPADRGNFIWQGE